MTSDDDEIEVGRSQRNRFGHVDPRVIEDDVFSVNAKIAYTGLTCHAGSARGGKIRRRTLAGDLGISPRTLDRALGELKLAGIVELIERRADNGARIANAYRLRDFLDLPQAVADRAEARAEERARASNSPPPLVTGDQGPLVTRDYTPSSPVTTPPSHPRPDPLVTGDYAKEQNLSEQKSPTGTGRAARSADPDGQATGQQTSTSASPSGRSSTPKGHRLPEDWQPTAELEAEAAEDAPDVDQAREFRRFRDHWLGASGRTATKTRWDTAYRNWMRRAQDDLDARRPRTSGQQQPPRRTAADERLAAGLDVVARLEAQERAEEERARAQVTAATVTAISNAETTDQEGALFAL
jgi:DNA-binding transcriptional ArsR family regulator